jgi:hypothetical protein
MIAGVAERRGVRRTIDRVTEEHTAEKQDLGSQKYPHAKRGCILLLLDVVELVPER